MKNMERPKFLQEILRKIKPSKKFLEKQKKVVEEIIEKIKSIEGKHIDVMLCGSAARNTHLKDDVDLDFFVFYPKEMPREEFEKEGLMLGKKVFEGKKYYIEYAEHPYVKGVYKGFSVEIIPTYKVEKAEMLKSAVDRSPFHLKYIKEKLNERLCDDVRLMKALLKSIDAYGAKLKFNSLPGFAIEIIIVYYNGFMNALKNISEWKINQVIDIEKHYKSEEEAIKAFNNHWLIIVDPTDKKRNVAAALSFNQYARIVALAREFLKKPSKRFFEKKKQKPLTKKEIEKLLPYKNFLFVEMPYPKNANPEIVYGQLRRLKKKISNYLKSYDFVPERIIYWTDESKEIHYIIELKSLEIEKVKIIEGPYVFMKEGYERFLEKHKRPFAGPRIQNGKIVVEELRKFYKAKDLLKHFFKSKDAFNKEPLSKVVNKAKILEKDALPKMLKKHKELSILLKTFLKGKDLIFA